jgi:hypothetical protein
LRAGSFFWKPIFISLLVNIASDLLTTDQSEHVNAHLVCKLYTNYPRANGEGTNSARLFIPGKTKALAESEVHQWSRAWVTNGGWSSSLISKIWQTVMNSEHWLVQFKICIITTAWRQRNSKHFLIWWFLANKFHFCKISWISKAFW